MVVSLEEIKLYLRVDGEEEDTLISTFINVSEDLVEGILRYPVSEFEILPEIIKQAVMYSVANMYEKREDYEKDCYSARYHTFYDSVRKRKRRSERS